jgi:hypothetical protein
MNNVDKQSQFLCALLQDCDTPQSEVTDSGVAIQKPTTSEFCAKRTNPSMEKNL